MQEERMQDVLHAQRQHWENTFSKKPDMFGEDPGEPAQKAAEVFKHEGRIRILV